MYDCLETLSGQAIISTTMFLALSRMNSTVSLEIDRVSHSSCSHFHTIGENLDRNIQTDRYPVFGLR